MWGIISTFITAAIHQAGDSSVKEVEWVFGGEGNPRKGEILGRRRWAHKDVALMSLEMERGSHEPSDAGDSKIWKRQEIIS